MRIKTRGGVKEKGWIVKTGFSAATVGGFGWSQFFKVFAAMRTLYAILNQIVRLLAPGTSVVKSGNSILFVRVTTLEV